MIDETRIKLKEQRSCEPSNPISPKGPSVTSEDDSDQLMRRSREEVDDSLEQCCREDFD